MCAYIASEEYISISKAAIQLQACWLAACKQYKQLRRKATQVKIENHGEGGSRPQEKDQGTPPPPTTTDDEPVKAIAKEEAPGKPTKC
uniref:Myosin-17-like n=1 Tax=Tanacetum cinerariifolium TaxID=118510 RepID=A0A699IEC0_TANCI|nr:myosin-17-like [Tanacetum cinerariifolium]